MAHLAPHLLARELAPLLERTAGRCVHACVDDRASKDDVRAAVLQPLDARGLADFALEHASAVSVVVSLETRSKKGWGLCRGPPESAEERAAELIVLAARQPTTKLPSGSLVRRGTRKSRLDVDANDMNQEAARRSWDAAEALCAVADAASSPES